MSSAGLWTMPTVIMTSTTLHGKIKHCSASWRSALCFFYLCYIASISYAAYQKWTLAANIPLQFYSTFSRELRLFPLMLTKQFPSQVLMRIAEPFILWFHIQQAIAYWPMWYWWEASDCIHEIKVLKSLQNLQHFFWWFRGSIYWQVHCL